jgi:hypothetical protein
MFERKTPPLAPTAGLFSRADYVASFGNLLQPGQFVRISELGQVSLFDCDGAKIERPHNMKKLATLIDRDEIYITTTQTAVDLMVDAYAPQTNQFTQIPAALFEQQQIRELDYALMRPLTYESHLQKITNQLNQLALVKPYRQKHGETATANRIIELLATTHDFVYKRNKGTEFEHRLNKISDWFEPVVFSSHEKTDIDQAVRYFLSQSERFFPCCVSGPADTKGKPTLAALGKRIEPVADYYLVGLNEPGWHDCTITKLALARTALTHKLNHISAERLAVIKVTPVANYFTFECLQMGRYRKKSGWNYFVY